MDDYVKKLAVEMFGAIPAGNIFGIPIMIDPTMPVDRIRIVHPVTGRIDEISLPE